MKTILWNLQLSCINKDNKFLLSNDSNFIFARNLISGLEYFFKDKYKIKLLIPRGSRFDEATENFRKLDSTVEMVECENYIKNVFNSRYHWNFEIMEDIVERNRIDIIWENNPSLVNNWKTLLFSLKKIDDIKIITYNHWIDSEQYPKIDRRCPYNIRQAEGMYLADMYLCNSKFALKQSSDNLYKTLNKTSRTSFVLPPIINEKEIHNGYNPKLKNEFVILYNHRLSSLNYYNSAYIKFVKCINEIEKYLDRSVKVIFTDVSGKVSSKNAIEIKETDKLKVELANNLNRNEYINLLWNSDLCVSTFEDNNGGCWSMSLAEAILSENAVLIPRHSGYAEMCSKDFIGYYDTYDQLCEKIIECVDHKDVLESNHIQASSHYKNFYSTETLIKELDHLIEGMYNE